VRSPASATCARQALQIGCSGIVVDLAAGHHRDQLVEQRDERAQQARLGLAAQAEQDEVMRTAAR
jgi:hypothetical protein